MTDVSQTTFANWNDISGYTAGFVSKYKRNPSITFEQALSLLQTAWESENAANLSATDYIELFEGAEADEETKPSDLVPDVVKDAISAAKRHPIALRAENLANDLIKDATFNAFIDGLNAKKLDVERGALDTLFHLRRVYGKRMAEFPIVGSKGGNNPDLYQGEYQKADGTTATKEFSFYTAFAASLPSYVAIVAERERVKLAISDPKAANVPTELRGKTKWFLNSKDKVLKNQLGNVKGWCVRACVIEQNLLRINEEMGTMVRATLVSHKNTETGVEEPAPGITDCFMVGDWSNGEASLFAAHETLNISKFTSLEIDEAIKNGGTYDALMATIKREPKKKGATTMAVGTFDALQSAWALSLGYVQTLKSSEQRAMLNAKIVSDKEGFLETVFDLKDLLLTICADTDLQKVYARHMQAKLKREASGETETKVA